MMYAKALFTAYAWQNLVPDWNHTTLTAGFGTFGGADYAAAGRNANRAARVCHGGLLVAFADRYGVSACSSTFCSPA
jgi:hypothetical protein